METLKNIAREKEDHFMMIKILIHQEDIILHNIFPILT